MTARITKLLLLFSGLLLSLSLAAQYPNNAIKSRLGWQTTGDGLVYRGAGAPAYSPGTLFNAWMYLDTTNYALYMYRNFQWTKLPLVNNGLTLDGSYVQLGGTLVENTTVERSTYTLDLGKKSGTNFGYASFYGTDPHYFGVLTKKDDTESGLTIGNKVWGFEVDDADHVSTLSGTRYGFDATYLGTLGVSQFKMDSGRFTIRTLPTYANHTLAAAALRTYQLYQLTNGAAIYTNTGTSSLVSPNIQDNGTAVSILNSKPFQFGQWTTAGRPSGVTGYTGFNTTFNWLDIYSSTGWFSPARAATTGGAFTSEYIPFGGSGGLTESDNLKFTSVSGVTRVNVNSSSAVNSGFLMRTSGVNRWTMAAYQAAGGNVDFTFYNEQTNIAALLIDGDSDELTVLKSANVLNSLKIGHSGVALKPVHLKGTSNTDVSFLVENTLSGTFGSARYKTRNNLGYEGDFLKWGSAADVYKTITPSSTVLYNSIEAGNLVLLNDFSTGNINFATGGSSTAQLTLASSGNLLLGTTTDATGYLLNMVGTGAMSLPRGTVAQRPTIASSTTPFRYNTDSTALEYGESVGTWRQLATRDYARSMKDGNGIYGGSDSLSQTNTYAAMAADGSQTLAIGYFPEFPDNNQDGNRQGGLYLSPTYWGQSGLYNSHNNITTRVNVDDGGSIMKTENFSQKRIGEFSARLGKVTLRASGVTNTDKNWILSLDSTKFQITRNISGVNRTYELLPPSQYPSTTSGVKQSLVWTGTGSEAAVAFENIPNIYNSDGTLTGDRTIVADGNELEINDLGGVYFETSDGNNYISLAETDVELRSTGTVGLIAGQNLSPYQASLTIQGEFDEESRVDYEVETRFGYHRVELDSTEFSISEALTGLGRDTLFKVEFEHDGRTTVKGKLRALREDYNNVTSTTSPVTLSSTIPDNLINQGSTQATFTLKMPASPVDGQICTITYANAISTLTLDGNGTTILGTVTTTAVAGSQRKYKYYSAASAWVRID